MKPIKRSAANTNVTGVFSTPFAPFASDAATTLDEGLLSRDLNIGILKQDDEARTEDFANSTIAGTDIIGEVQDFVTTMELQYFYMMVGGSSSEFAVSGTFAGRTPTCLNRWAFTGDMTLTPVVDTTPTENAAVPTTFNYVDYVLRTEGELEVDSGYRAFSSIIGASIEQRSPRPVRTYIQSNPPLECTGELEEPIRLRANTVQLPNGSDSTVPFTGNSIIEHRGRTLICSATQVYDVQENRTFNLSGVRQGFRDMFGWVVLRGGNLIRLNGEMWFDFSNGCLALQRFNSEIWACTSDRLFQYEKSGSRFGERKLAAPFIGNPAGFLLLDNRLHYISITAGNTVSIYSMGGTLVATGTSPTTVGLNARLIQSSYSGAGLLFTLESGTTLSYGFLIPNNLSTATSRWSMQLGLGSAHAVGLESWFSTSSPTQPTEEFSRYVVDARIYTKLSDSPPFSLFPTVLDTTLPSDASFQVVLDGNLYSGIAANSIVDVDGNTWNRYIRSAVRRGSNLYGVVVYANHTLGQQYVTLVLLTFVSVSTLSDRIVIRVASVGSSVILNGAPNNGWVVPQDEQRSTLTFNDRFYPTAGGIPLQAFDFKAWTNWDLPLWFRYQNFSFYASTGLQPEAIELKLGLEGDNSAFSVLAHSMFEDPLEVDLGLDPSVLVTANPVRVTQDVRMFLLESSPLPPVVMEDLCLKTVTALFATASNTNHEFSFGVNSRPPGDPGAWTIVSDLTPAGLSVSGTGQAAANGTPNVVFRIISDVCHDQADSVNGGFFSASNATLSTSVTIRPTAICVTVGEFLRVRECIRYELANGTVRYYVRSNDMGIMDQTSVGLSNTFTRSLISASDGTPWRETLFNGSISTATTPFLTRFDSPGAHVRFGIAVIHNMAINSTHTDSFIIESLSVNLTYP